MKHNSAPVSALRQWRLAKRYKLIEIAKYFGISPGNLHAWETKQIPADKVRGVAMLTKIAAAKLRPDIFGKR